MTIQTPPMLGRSQWNARPPTGSPGPLGPVTAITVHHTGSIPDQGTFARDIRWIQDYHQTSGWVDIAYHYLIARATHFAGAWPMVIAVGRAGIGGELALGGHVRSKNRGNAGIAIIGNYSPADAGKEFLSSEQCFALEWLLSWLCSQHKLQPRASVIRGHRDWQGHETNACPGDAIHIRLPVIRNNVGLMNGTRT